MKFHASHLFKNFVAIACLGLITCLSSCKKEPARGGIFDKKEEKYKKISKAKELDFLVKNKTGKTIYAACFYYAKKSTGHRWRWYKSAVYTLNHGDQTIIDIETLPEQDHLGDVYGYLGVFNTYKEAETSVYELLKDTEKLDLGKLTSLAHQPLILEAQDYGDKGRVLDYRLRSKTTEKGAVIPELDFLVENNTTKNLWVTCFSFAKETPYHTQWHFSKTPVQHLKAKSSIVMDVSTIADDYDRKNVRGYLGVFEDSEKQAAEDATYELLSVHKKLNLGKLYKLRNKKIVIEEENYGVLVDRDYQTHETFYEYTIENAPAPEAPAPAQTPAPAPGQQPSQVPAQPAPLAAPAA